MRKINLNSPDTKHIFTSLDNNARFVGGCVRDALLGIKAKDIDIATPHTPQEVIDRLKSSNIRTIPTGIEHGTVTAVINQNSFEITTLRADIECDGRHAKVKFTDDWEQDAARRDFTINAMSCDINGKIYDYFSGQDDLNAGIIRFVGNAEQRCKEDILRILRFFRFNAYYSNNKINPQGLEACKKFSKQIAGLSGERIQTEMLKLFSAPNPLPALQAMDYNKIAAEVFYSQIDLSNLSNLIEVEKSLPQKEISPLLRIALIIKNSALNEINLRWKLSNKHKKYLKNIITNAEKINIQLDLVEQRKLIRAIGRDIFIDVTMLKCAKDIENKRYYLKAIANADNWQIPTFPVSGKDLAKLGIAPGSSMGKILKEAEKNWENRNYLPTKDEILSEIKKDK